MTRGDSVRKGHNHRGSVSALVLGCSALAAGIAAATLLTGGERERIAPVDQVQSPVDHDVQFRLEEHAIDVPEVPALHATITPIGGGESGGGVAGACPPAVKTYSGADFSGGEFMLQAGFVETEIAAAEFVVPPEDFPLKIDMTEMIFAQLNATVGTTTHWSLMVWEGNPQTGVLVEVFSSDDLILPHIGMPPGTHGVNVQVSVDPNDPEQIIIQANPSNSFTIGYRIDKHNNPPTAPCQCLPPFPFTLPAVCCPPPTNSNAFPTTDPTGMTNASKNWLFARDCQGSVCAAPAGWYTFPQLGSYQPSGDWNIRVTYTPLGCEIVFGACCLPSGCQTLSNFQCADQGGVFQGANTTCAGVTCPFGACCDNEGFCQMLSSTACESIDGTYNGDGSTCAGVTCPGVGACCFGGAQGSCFDAYLEEHCDLDGGVFFEGMQCQGPACALLLGACCVPSTGQCAQDVEVETCDMVGGNWQGAGSKCADIICFPIGACCLPDGSCAGQVSPEQCAEAGGTFQGHESTCAAVNCPQPSGACCLPNSNCVVATSVNCNAFGGEWQGGDTSCADNNGNGLPDACEPSAPDCPADLTGSGSVGVPDLLQLLAAWGSCPPACPADLTGNGSVGVPDLLQLLASWGPCQ